MHPNSLKNLIPFPKGHITSKEVLLKANLISKDKRPKGENHYNWKGGLRRSDCARYNRERRHRLGISKRYKGENWGDKTGKSYTTEYKKIQHQKRRLLARGGGYLSVKIIQMIYEDNIKKFGTLTCYLCLKPVDFGKDHLEHKTPLSRGGKNTYDNLEVSCPRCNLMKRNKTVEEFMSYATNI